MKKSRKKRAPKVSTDALNSWKQDATRDDDLEKLSVRLLQCEELRQEQVLNTPFIALECPICTRWCFPRGKIGRSTAHHLVRGVGLCGYQCALIANICVEPRLASAGSNPD